MTKRALTLIALALVAATAVTAASAFAGSENRCRDPQDRREEMRDVPVCQPVLSPLVAAQAADAAQAAVLLKLRKPPYRRRAPDVRPPILK